MDAQFRAVASAGPRAIAAPARLVTGRAVPVMRYLAGVLVLAAAYYAAGRASLALQYRGPVAAIWLPTGVGAAALYLAGLRWWPGLLIGDVALADPAQPLGSALALTAGNVADIVVIALLLRRLLGPRGILDRREHVAALLVAIVAGATITATVATISLRVADIVASSETLTFWRSWSLADASGALVMIPLALAWAQPPSRAWQGRRAWEGALMIAAVAGLSAIALSADLPLLYLVFPALIWAALRLGPRGGTLAVAVASGMAVGITANEVGPFVAHSITDSALGTQLYIAVAALTTLFLAAIASERRRALLELADARARILAATDAERRRIERDLHDGAQQRLTGLRVKLGLADDLIQRDPDSARRMVDELGADIDEALTDVRSLASGIYPPLLVDFGLTEALRDLARHAPLAASVEIDGTDRCRPEVEAAVYFCCTEALQNAAKHAGAATTISISLKRHRAVNFEVHDDGRGFSPAHVRSGQGLANMRDRIEAVGGKVEVRSSPGIGTRVIGHIPNP
jgi:signal transduction histidine kinase